MLIQNRMLIQKDRKETDDINKKYKIMVVHLNPNISITILSINAINAPVKRYTFLKIQLCLVIQIFKNRKNLKVKNGKDTFYILIYSILIISRQNKLQSKGIPRGRVLYSVIMLYFYL